MSHRSVGQLSLADQLVKRRAGQNEGLVRLAAMIQWRPLERALAAVCNASEGRPSYPPLVMFKCLLLQQWYMLSDPQLEEALADRLSFRRFAGLPPRLVQSASASCGLRWPGVLRASRTGFTPASIKVASSMVPCLTNRPARGALKYRSVSEKGYSSTFLNNLGS
jgi:hypothetical protein